MRINSIYRILSLLSGVLFCILVASCEQETFFASDDERNPEFAIVGTPVQVYLSISTGAFSFDVTTRTEVPTEGYDGQDTEDERHVDDLWIFEYDAVDKSLVNTPLRVEIASQEELEDLEVTLADNNGNPVVIYVVANAGSGVEDNSKNWVTSTGTPPSYQGFMTLDELEANIIPTPHPQRLRWDGEKYVLETQDASALSIPMSGKREGVTVSSRARITVNVTRMFAKIMVRVDLSEFTSDYEEALLSTVTVGNIPEYCRVVALGSSTTTTAADYSGCDRWIRRKFDSVGESSTESGSGSSAEVYPYIIYVPENIQGENGEDEDKEANVPNSYALSVAAGIYVVTHEGSTLGEYTFTAYPGGNDKNNFNVRRNCLYLLTIKVNDLIDDILPSANCIMCPSGEITAFWPYCRTETGGGYDFTDYLDANGDDESKKIDHVEIIWQSTDGNSGSGTGFIGNNSKYNLVWIDNVGDVADEYHRKIHVSIPEGKTGNALIGAYNSDGVIIWSWHIWSRTRETSPTTVGVKLYYTYDWDEKGIYGYDSGRPRVAGYSIMNCNLGAMQDEPSNFGSSTEVAKTYGMLYQWGRKDPFPPATKMTGTSIVLVNYDTSYVGNYYDNSNNKVGITSGAQSSNKELFYSVPGSERKEIGTAILNTIHNPCVFYAGTKLVNQKSGNYVGFSDNQSTALSALRNNYPSPQDGNWLLDSNNEHFNCLWGGLDPEHDAVTKMYDTGLRDLSNTPIHMYDDYGEKSIFDPCPYGWRISPPDLWLGFTRSGLNPSRESDLNAQTLTNYGLQLYLTDWKNGETTYFPTQGTRMPDGSVTKVGSCGNYHNATADVGDRVNILHIHNDVDNFKIFENYYLVYYLKSTAGSVRCVRIDSVQETDTRSTN